MTPLNGNMQTMKLLYKYKALSSLSDLDRLLDIIRNTHIFMPRYDQLNDPLEGEGININISGYAGISFSRMQDREPEPIERTKKQFRILSLSSDALIPQMWAHYCQNYNGVCLCFMASESFREAREVKYCKEKKETCSSPEDFQDNRLEERSFVKGTLNHLSTMEII